MMLGWRLTLLALLSIAPAWASSVQIPVSDGVVIHGELHGSGEQGVILLHDQARSKEDWADLGRRLRRSDFRVLAVDLRGHGASTPPDPMEPSDWEALPEDVAQVAAWLRDQGVTDLSVIGAGLGANVALHAAGEDEQIGNLVLLSPGLNIRGHNIVQPIEAYGERPVMLVVGSGDTQSARAASLVETRTQGPQQVLTRDTDASGVRLLSRDADLTAEIIGWLNRSFDASEPDLSEQDLELGSPSGEEAFETRGERLEDRGRTPR